MSLNPLVLNISSRSVDLVNQISSDFLERAIEYKQRNPNRFPVQLRFRERFASNSSLVIARAFVDYLNQYGVLCESYDLGESYNYANRIGFFNDFTNSEYSYQKHAANGRFIELEKITSSDTNVSTRVSDSLIEFSERDGVFISDEAIDILTYSVGELISNVRRHAQSTGRVSFQYYRGTGRNEITVCDCGVGIISTLRSAGCQGTEEELLKQSILKNVTSSIRLQPYGEQSPGVGLYNICRLAQQNDGASVTIATKNYMMTVSKEYPIENPVIQYLTGFFPGTIVVVNIPNLIHINLKDVLSENLSKSFSFF